MCVLKTVRFVQFAPNVKRMRLVSPSLFLSDAFFTFVPDKEYRKGVHWLETLRLRRTKILESAYKVQVHVPVIYVNF